MRPAVKPRKNPAARKNPAGWGRYALYAGAGAVGMYGAYRAYAYLTTPAPALRAGASLAFKQAAEGATGGAAQDDLGIVWYGSENHSLSEATNKIITDAQASRYLAGTVGAPGSQYAIKLATLNGSALLKCGYWLAVAGSYLRNASILSTAKDYLRRGFVAASALTGDSGNFESVRAIYAAASAVLAPYQSDKQIRYVLGILNTPVTSPGSYDVQKQAAEDKNVIINTVKQTGQDIADVGTRVATGLAWVGGVITGKPPIGSNPVAFFAWKWGVRAAVVVGGYLAIRAYTRPYVAAAKVAAQRGVVEAAETIKKMASEGAA